MHYLTKFFITMVVFMGIDLIWLGFVARKVYVHYLGPFLRTPPNWPAAFVFYTLFIIGLIIYAVEPAIIARSVKKAMFLGAMFGFFTYMTYDLTNLATLKDWPVGVVFIDIAWGIVLSASVASCSTLIYLKFFN